MSHYSLQVAQSRCPLCCFCASAVVECLLRASAFLSVVPSLLTSVLRVGLVGVGLLNTSLGYVPPGFRVPMSPVARIHGSAPSLKRRATEVKCDRKLGRVMGVLLGHFVPCLHTFLLPSEMGDTGGGGMFALAWKVSWSTRVM